MAVGAAIALARLARERRERLSERERRLGLQPRERPAEGVRRMAVGQVDLILDLLEDGAPDERSVHEMRKALKRLRALLRLLRTDLGEDAYARENALLRELAGRLSGARDAEVMLGTLDALIERHPRKLARRRRVRGLRRELAAERKLRAAETLAEPATRARALAEMQAFRARVAGWSLPERQLGRAGLLRLYAQGRMRFRRARRSGGSDAQAMHRWRKRVKDIRYVAEMLERERPKHRRKGGRGKRDARLHRLAKRADALGETLGEDHDLAVLAGRVRETVAKGRTRKSLLKLIERRRRELREQALRDGKRLYRRSPKRFVARVS